MEGEKNERASILRDQYNKFAVFMIFVVPATGGFLFGYDIGATSYCVTQIADASYGGVTFSHMIDDSSVLKGAVTAAATLGAFIGSVMVFPIADKIGRRRELQIGAVLYMVGSVLELISGLFDLNKYLGITILSVGRIIYGVGIGFSMHGAPTYIAEMSPPSLRGALVSMKEAVIVLGMLSGYAVGYINSEHSGNWKYTYVASAPIAFLMLLGTFRIPRSARWLLLSDSKQEAFTAVQYVFPGINQNDDVFTSMLEQAEEQRAIKRSAGAGANLFSPKFRAAMVAGVGVVLLQQVTGQPSILSYVTPIFKEAGLDSYSAVLIGAFKLFATIFAVITVEKHGRKKLLTIGCSLMLCGLIAVVIAYWGQDGDAEGQGVGARQYVILGAMFLYIGGYQVGFGPIAWLLISEVFPLEVRGQAVAFAVQTNFFWNSVVAFSEPAIGDAIGLSAMFGIFAGLTVFALFFIQRYVPETRGLTLEEIEQQFARTRKGTGVLASPLIGDV